MTVKQRREFRPEFKREAVGVLGTSGRTIRQVAGDLDLGLSTLNRWKRELRDAILAPSTSALAGSDFLGPIARPEKALVVHPVNPPSPIPLVELCGTRWTTPEILEKCQDIDV
jgi:transposase-like protein